MIAERYPIPARDHRVEEEIRRSRFITSLGHAPTVAAAQAFIAERKAEFGDASHNCWAYVAGAPGSTAQVGMSDDGEPHGTAGRPMLTVLTHSGIGEIVAVVTRYFGGTLLGKGGLVRAYSGGVRQALETLPVVDKIPKSVLTVVFDYSSVTPFQRLLPDHEVEVLQESYGAEVTVRLQLPDSRVEEFCAVLTELTHGGSLIQVEGPAESP